MLKVNAVSFSTKLSTQVYDSFAWDIDMFELIKLATWGLCHSTKCKCILEMPCKSDNFSWRISTDNVKRASLLLLNKLFLVYYLGNIFYWEKKRNGNEVEARHNKSEQTVCH